MTDENDLTAAYMAGLADRDDAMRKACVAAATKALREAAEYIEAMTEDDSLTAAHVSYIRARADAIEKGEA